jgi:hypothetical protein
MITKKDTAAVKEMIYRLGVADFLALVGNVLHEKSLEACGTQTPDGLALSRAAEKCWEASEQ